MEIKHILIIRFRRIGDSVLALTLLHNLRREFPNAQLDFVLNKGIAPLYEGHPDIDRIITFDHQEEKHIFKYLKKVRSVVKETKYDVIIDMRSTVRTLFFSLFSLSTPYRIGGKKKYNHWVHNYRIDHKNQNDLDRIQQNLLLLNPLSKEGFKQGTPDFHLYTQPEAVVQFRKYMEEKGIDFSKPVVFATVTARLSHKIWNKKYMKEVLKRMIEYYDTQIIFNFNSDEKESALEMQRELNNDPHIFTSIEAKSLQQLCALLSNCDFFFGNEGGPRHIAQAIGVPAYAIYSPNISMKTWLPNASMAYQGISPDMLCRPEQQKKMDYTQRFNLITPDIVWKNVEAMLQTLILPSKK